jgi:hypothetical protein
LGCDFFAIDVVIESFHTETLAPGCTPGDVDLAAQRAAAAAFDRIREGKKPLHTTSEDLEAAVARTRPSVTAEIRDRFAEEVGRFARV